MAAKKKSKKAKNGRATASGTAKARHGKAKRAAKKGRSSPSAKRATASTKRSSRRPAAKPPKSAAAARKRPAKKKAAPRPAPKGIQRQHGGRYDPKYARDLLSLSGGHEKDPRSFIDKPRARDDLAEELGEEVVAEATSGENEGADLQSQEVPEERGGPFVVTTAGQEFADGPDASNPKGAKREPFPTT